MNIFQFMTESPWLTFFLAMILSETLVRIIVRMVRTINLQKLGYPPPHCDADGDFKKENDDIEAP
jgi:hypothetical protein